MSKERDLLRKRYDQFTTYFPTEEEQELLDEVEELLAQPEPDKNLSFYITEYNIPTLEIGTGSVIIGDLYALDGTYSGVSFSKTEGGEINKTHKETFGKDVVENNAFFQIISTNPKSTKVLIDKLKLSYDNFGIKHPKNAKQEQEPKPVAWITEWIKRYKYNGDPIIDRTLSFTKDDAPTVPDPNYIPLYTAPPSQKPLSLTEIQRIWDENAESGTRENFVRAIEKAHGIGE